jgi:hypothetical protein
MPNLELALRATEVKRWTIVALTRPQSLAEHQYRVYHIACAIAEAIGVDHHNSLDMAAIERWALAHDLHEVLTGDIPATAKAVAPDVYRLIEENARDVIEVRGGRGHKGTIVDAVVKLADITETALFAYQNGGLDRRHVMVSLRDQFRAAYGAAAKQGSYQWGKVPGVLKSCLPADEVWAVMVDDVTRGAAND